MENIYSFPVTYNGLFALATISIVLPFLTAVLLAVWVPLGGIVHNTVVSKWMSKEAYWLGRGKKAKI
jgi:hypothetical protein